MSSNDNQQRDSNELKVYGGDSHIFSSQLQGLQGQFDKQAQLLQNVIFAVVIGLVFVVVTVAVEVILFHGNSVSEEEYMHALEQSKENTNLLIENKLKDFKLMQ